MQFNVKANNDNDIENAKQLELILNMKLSSYENISHIIKENIDMFKSSEPCIMRGHELLISNNSSFDQEIKDEIDKQIMDIGMAAYHVETTSKGIHIKPINTNEMYAVMPAVIGGLKHDILIVDDIYNPMNNYIEVQHEKPFPINVVPFYPRNYASKQCLELVDGIIFQEEKQPKENHPYGWYRKFEKKRF